MTKIKKNNPVMFLLLNTIVVMLNLIFLYYTKYSNQNLSLSKFSLNNIGNILNLLFAFILFAGLLVAHLRRVSLEKKIYYSLLFLSWLFLLIAFVSTKISVPFDQYYFLGQKGNRLFIGLNLTLFQFTYFTLTFVVWHKIFQTKSVVLIRAGFNASFLMFFVLILSFVLIVAKENKFSQSKISSSPNNIAVVLGAAVWSKNKLSPTLEFRVKKSIELIKKGKVSKIFLTGGNAPGELAESVVAFNYVKSQLNNTSNIFTEEKTTSTYEQIQYIENNLIKSGIRYNVIVISDSYHLIRVMEISKFHNLNIQVAKSDLALSFEKALYFKVREAVALTVFWFFAF